MLGRHDGLDLGHNRLRERSHHRLGLQIRVEPGNRDPGNAKACKYLLHSDVPVAVIGLPDALDLLSRLLGFWNEGWIENLGYIQNKIKKNRRTMIQIQ